jgi:hypothetical protein
MKTSTASALNSEINIPTGMVRYWKAENGAIVISKTFIAEVHTPTGKEVALITPLDRIVSDIEIEVAQNSIKRGDYSETGARIAALASSSNEYIDFLM